MPKVGVDGGWRLLDAAGDGTPSGATQLVQRQGCGQAFGALAALAAVLGLVARGGGTLSLMRIGLFVDLDTRVFQRMSEKDDYAKPISSVSPWRTATSRVRVPAEYSSSACG